MNLKEILTPEEFASVTKRSNLAGARVLLTDWTIIAGTFFVAAQYPNPLVMIAAVFVLGARQLGLSVVVHETGHRTLFESNRLNDFCGRWLSGYFVFSDKDTYMRGHLKHHQLAGTAGDPDLKNYQAFPVPVASLRRKIWRDLSGQLGWRRVKSIGRSIRRLPTLPAEMQTYVIGSIAMNAGLLAILAASGHAWLYLLWVVAFMTTHMLVVRIRQIGEHAAVPDLFDPDPRKNTRTMEISWLERLLIAPHGVSYHLEHHLLASVPIYRLKRLHRLLRQKGFYEGVEFPGSYINLLRSVTVAA